MKKWKAYPRYIFRKEIALSMISKYIADSCRFLEIGCASGDFGISLAKKGHSGVLLDFSEDAPVFVKQNLEENKDLDLDFVNIDFNEFETQNKFDLITMFEVLEHIEDEKAVLFKISNLLKEGGYFLFSVPSRKKFWGASDEFVGHLRRYEKEDIKKLLDNSDFEIVQLISYGYPFLNLIKYFRDKAIQKKLNKLNRNITEQELTKKSGLNVVPIKIPFFNLIINQYTLCLPIKFSCLFNSMDLAEGYLCLCKKKIKDE